MRALPYLEIVRELEKRIRAGVYPADTALPPRPELAREFGVARATLDRAIRELAHSGLVAGRYGSGTYVAADRGRRRRVAQVGGGGLHERAGNFELRIFSPADLSRRSAWEKLLEYDGVLWVRPERQSMEIIAELRGRTPQVAVNRVIPGIHCVSTDHRGAYRQIAAERLARLPEARVFFLANAANSIVTGYRRDGFIDACREAGRFYDLAVLPADFAGKVALLEERLPRAGEGPLLLGGDSLSHTGAVMRWGLAAGAQWGRGAFYSDFDDDYPAAVWGVEVTSFLQDEEALYLEAAAWLGRLLESGPSDEFERLIFPQFRQGDT